MTTKIEDTNMNEIIAIIQPHALTKVMHAIRIRTGENAGQAV